MTLNEVLTSVPGIGPSTYLKLQKHGIETQLDLLRLFPTRHEDYSLLSPIALLQPGETVTIKAEVVTSQQVLTRKRNLTIQKLQVKDLSDSTTLVWFNQPYILRQFRKGEQYYFSGKITQLGNQISMQVLEYEPDHVRPLNTASIVPYYTGTMGISSRLLRQKIAYILDRLPLPHNHHDPVSTTSGLRLMPVFNALRALHFPKNATELEQAKKRLSFEQLLTIKISQISQQARLKEKKTVCLPRTASGLIQKFKKLLPFKLTPSQINAVTEITRDFVSSDWHPRLLMGDVGSGKTVIMAYAAFIMAKSGFTTAVMAPTTALAQQHYLSFKQWFRQERITISLLTAKAKPGPIQKAAIVIGTQALLFQEVDYNNLGLVIIDEQHKFGVVQAEWLTLRAKFQPRFLLVSATPIPRSLALILYHHTQLSYLKEKPFINQVKTYLVPEQKRQSGYRWLSEQIRKHHQQAFVVCPAIDPQASAKLELKTVKQEAQKLSQLLPGVRIQAIYSQHPQKLELLQDFKKGKIDLLVTTTLIEVGLDIGSVNIMLIENAERFGLSQLHQLRGRIGRRGQLAHFFLFPSSTEPKALTRLQTLVKNNDAAAIALADLKHRGAGNLLGTAQHGFGYLQTEDLLNPGLIAEVNRLATKLVANSQHAEYTSLLVKKLT